MQSYQENGQQSFIELKFNNNNVFELSQEDALLKYKTNAYILGRIFSTDVEIEDDEVSSNADMVLFSDEQLNQYRQEISQLNEQNKNRLEQFQELNKNCHKIIEQISKLDNKDKIKSFSQQLKEQNYYDQDHPFFNELSSYYFQSQDTPFQKIVQNQQSFKEWENNPKIVISKLN